MRALIGFSDSSRETTVLCRAVYLSATPAGLRALAHTSPPYPTAHTATGQPEMKSQISVACIACPNFLDERNHHPGVLRSETGIISPVVL
jgi:hypothetical protein